MLTTTANIDIPHFSQGGSYSLFLSPSTSYDFTHAVSHAKTLRLARALQMVMVVMARMLDMGSMRMSS
jgi:hypothetical protein